MTRFSSKRRFLLGKKLLLEGEIKITELSLTLRFTLLEQNELPKKQKRNLKSSLEEKTAVKKWINKLLCESSFCVNLTFTLKVINLRQMRFYLNQRFERFAVFLFSFFFSFFIFSFFLLPQVFPQLLQRLLWFLFGSGTG